MTVHYAVIIIIAAGSLIQNLLHSLHDLNIYDTCSPHSVY